MKLITALILLCASAIVAAQPFDSSLAGDYVGGQYACRIVPTIMPGAQQRGVVWTCTVPDGGQVVGASWGPDCPGAYSIYALSRWGSWPDGTVYARIINSGGGSLLVQIGGLEVYAGGGQLIQMFRAQPITAPSPYSCAASVKPSK